jgi:hypothetical protein
MRQAIREREQRDTVCGAGATGFAARRAPAVSAVGPAVRGPGAPAYIYSPPEPERPRRGGTL